MCEHNITQPAVFAIVHSFVRRGFCAFSDQEPGLGVFLVGLLILKMFRRTNLASDINVCVCMSAEGV